MKNKDLGWELDPVQLLLQVSMFEKTLLHDIMKAARGAAVSRCAASNRSQMFCSPLCIADATRGSDQAARRKHGCAGCFIELL